VVRKAKYPNGFVIFGRFKLLEDLWTKKPPSWLKAYLYILQHVSWKDPSPTQAQKNPALPPCSRIYNRGTGYFHWPSVSNELHGVSADQWKRTVGYLEQRGIITRRRVTGELTYSLITVVDYDDEQNWKSYKTEDVPFELQPERSASTRKRSKRPTKAERTNAMREKHLSEICDNIHRILQQPNSDAAMARLQQHVESSFADYPKRNGKTVWQEAVAATRGDNHA